VRLENTFEVPAPPERAWELLNDIPTVIPCMPGAELTETIDATHWRATLHVKLGPIALQFATDVEQAERDEAAQRAVLAAKARELKGRGAAEATITSSLEPAGTGTRVALVTELTLRGTVAQYGRGIVGDVSNQLVKRFADCLAAKLQESPPPPAAQDGHIPVGQVSEGHVQGSDPEPPPPEVSAKPEPKPKPVGGIGLAMHALWDRMTGFLRKR
jgi:carbon monoxide dehydrogenase subunit G